MKQLFLVLLVLTIALAACSSPASDVITEALPDAGEMVATSEPAEAEASSPEEPAESEELVVEEEPAATEEPVLAEEPAATEAEEAAASEVAAETAADQSLTGEEASPSIEPATVVEAVDVASGPAATIANTEGYFRLETLFLEDESDCLEGNRVAPESTLEGAAFMSDCSGLEDQGELWKLVPAADGYYRLQPQSLEADNQCLEGNKFAEGAAVNGAAFMSECQDVSGQLWRFVASEVEGYYRLQTQFLQAENLCLEGNRVASESVLGGAAFMDNCLNVTGQLWKLVSPHWGYEGELGPEAWAGLDDKYAMCDTGTQQSPIDLPAEPAPSLADVVFSYQETAAHVINNGHTIEVESEEGGSIEIDGQTYELRQFHFHAPSEHAVSRRHYPIEMHLVHYNEESDTYAVVGVFVEEGEENEAFAPFWVDLPAGEEDSTEIEVNPAELLPEVQTVYRYHGSLTTPTCREGVLWSVMNMPIQMSAAQIAAFTDIYSGNNRPLQPMQEQGLQVSEEP